MPKISRCIDSDQLHPRLDMPYFDSLSNNFWLMGLATNEWGNFMEVVTTVCIAIGNFRACMALAMPSLLESPCHVSPSLLISC